MEISASVYSASPFNLASAVAEVSGRCQSWHFDVMDGAYTHAFGLNLAVFEELQVRSNKPIDVHLMLRDPAPWAMEFAERGARAVAFNIEPLTAEEITEICLRIKKAGADAYLALEPWTELSPVLERYSGVCDGLLLLSSPAGGGRFYPEVLRRSFELPSDLPYMIDGGINFESLAALRQGPYDRAVMGRALFAGLNAAES